MIAAGFECQGKRTADIFECNEYFLGSEIADFKSGVEFDHLEFTDLDGNESLIIYLNNGSGQLCQSDLSNLKKAGIKNGICKPRKKIKS